MVQRVTSDVKAAAPSAVGGRSSAVVPTAVGGQSSPVDRGPVRLEDDGISLGCKRGGGSLLSWQSPERPIDASLPLTRPMMPSSLSRKILFGIILLFVLSLFGMGGFISRYTELMPPLVFPGMEIWRLLTYPLGYEFLGLIIGAICFSAPGEEMEQMLGTRQFGLLLLLVTIVTALMHMSIFFGELEVLAGPVNAALFVLVGFVYLFPHSEIRVIFFSVRSWVVLAFIVSIIVAVTVFQWSEGYSFLFFSRGGFGLVLGAAYFHVRFQKYAVLLRPIRSVERIVAGGRGGGVLKPAAGAPRRAAVSQSTRLRMPFQKSSPREISDEERLNLILDRINESSYSSLSEEEKRFLRDYSGKI